MTVRPIDWDNYTVEVRRAPRADAPPATAGRAGKPAAPPRRSGARGELIATFGVLGFLLLVTAVASAGVFHGVQSRRAVRTLVDSGVVTKGRITAVKEGV